jgi:hypothetical protein
MMADMTKKHPTSFRLSEECLRLIKLLAGQLGVAETAVVELAVRRMAKSESIEPTSATPKRKKG